jgi:hypothetical protein
MVNTVTPMSSHACRCPKCQPARLATRPPGPLVQASRPSFTPQVHRYGTSSLTFTSPSATISVLHTCTTQAKRHVAHKAFAKVGLITTQPTSWITLTITHHKTNTQGYLSTLCSHLVLRVLFPLVADGQMYYGYCINCLYPAMVMLRTMGNGHSLRLI